MIAFNADSPHLPADVLESAFTALATVDVVVGPCDDGGYYLVGAKRQYPGLFEASAMGRTAACAALLAEADRQNLDVSRSAEHYDIDLPSDVTKLARQLRSNPRAPGARRRSWRAGLCRAASFLAGSATERRR